MQKCEDVENENTDIYELGLVPESEMGSAETMYIYGGKVEICERELKAAQSEGKPEFIAELEKRLAFYKEMESKAISKHQGDEAKFVAYLNGNPEKLREILGDELSAQFFGS